MTTPIDLTQFNGCTPGPWASQHGFVRDAQGRIVCQVSVEAAEHDSKVKEANGIAIAAHHALVAEVKALRLALRDCMNLSMLYHAGNKASKNIDDTTRREQAITQARSLLPKE